MNPTIGRIVCYSLSLTDIEHIETQRQHVAELLHVHPGQIGNTYVPGDIAPLLVTRVWSPHLVNGQVILDGGDTLWKTSATLNHQPASGTWHWPVIEPAIALVPESVAPINTAECGRCKDWTVWRNHALDSAKIVAERDSDLSSLNERVERLIIEREESEAKSAKIADLQRRLHLAEEKLQSIAHTLAEVF